MEETTPIELTGLEKASLLLIALGTKTAGSVLQQLNPEEVQLLCAQIAKQKHVEPTVQEKVIEDFKLKQREFKSAGGIEYARQLLEESVGPTKAKEFMEYIGTGSGVRPFDWVKGSASSRLATLLQEERPQVVALVLANFSADHAAEVLSLLPPEIQGKVAHKLTTMQPVAPEIVRTIDEMLHAKLSREGSGDLKAVGGIPSLVLILNSADRTTEHKIIEYLETTEAEVAESVKQMMFMFEDIINLDDRTVQIVIREIEQEDLRLSMKGAADEIREHFYKNMSERAAEALKEDLEMMGPVKRKDVEAAQRKVVAVVRRLDETGEISLRANDEDVIK